MKSIIVWIIISAGELSGGYLIFVGFIKVKHESLNNKIKYFHQGLPVSEHSGAKLIFEGIGVILSGILLHFAFFLW
jgi:hypothetical protein